jgi:uncharacterized coiled-coil DUF342 family protein
VTNPKDQLNLYYEQQSILIDQIKVLRKALQEEQKLTTRYRKERDRYKAERQSLLEKALPDTEGRESQKEMIDGLKKRRDFLRRQAQTTDSSSFKILSNDELQKLTLVELKFRLYELEFKQQTSSLERDEEEIMVDEINRIEERIELLEKRNEVIVADYLGNVPETKDKIHDEISRIETKITGEEQVKKEMQSKLQKIYSRITPLKEEEDKAHQLFVDHLQKVEENKIDVQAKQEELDSLKGKIAQIKKKITQESQQVTIDKIEEQIQQLLRKKEEGKSLTPEEQEFLMSYGHVPF